MISLLLFVFTAILSQLAAAASQQTLSPTYIPLSSSLSSSLVQSTTHPLSAASGRFPAYAIILIAVACAVMVPTFAWCIFIRNRSTSKPLTDYEKQAITVAVQQALEQWHQSRAERRERARAEMSKPVKSNMDDIDTVVLNLNNKDHILTRSLAVSHSSVAIDIDSDAVNVAIDVDEYDDADKDDIEPAAATLARARTLARVTTDVTIRPDQNASASHECCSVCIEELAVGDSVRVLPACRHVFHVACIDPWLTTASALCPLCKTDTRTSEEQAEYNRVVATANASLEASAAVPANISQGVHAIFNQIVDEICMERLGYVIKRDRSLSISASYVGNETTALFFRTTVFIRDGNGSEISNNGWRNRLLYGPGNRLRYPDLYEQIRLDPECFAEVNKMQIKI